MDLRMPLVFAIMGYLFSTRKFILFMDRLNPLNGLIVYYSILLSALLVLEYFGLIIAGIEFNTTWHSIGSILIIFSFFITIEFESCHANMITKGHCDSNAMSNIYIQSEDGAMYWIWSHFTKNFEALRWLTYVITPFVLSLIGSLMITQKVQIGI